MNSLRQYRNRFFLPKGILVLLAVVVVMGILTVPGCAPSSQPVQSVQQEATVGVNVGDLAPDFTLTDLEGNQVSLSDFRGKAVFINFWATWCPPCRAEMPEIEAVYQEYKDKNVVVVGVDILETEDKVRQFVERGGYSWIFVIDTTGEVTNNYGIAAIPTSFFIDRDGIIKAVNIGAMTKRAMEAKLAEAMR